MAYTFRSWNSQLRSLEGQISVTPILAFFGEILHYYLSYNRIDMTIVKHKMVLSINIYITSRSNCRYFIVPSAFCAIFLSSVTDFFFMNKSMQAAMMQTNFFLLSVNFHTFLENRMEWFLIASSTVLNSFVAKFAAANNESCRTNALRMASLNRLKNV